MVPETTMMGKTSLVPTLTELTFQKEVCRYEKEGKVEKWHFRHSLLSKGRFMAQSALKELGSGTDSTWKALGPLFLRPGQGVRSWSHWRTGHEKRLTDSKRVWDDDQDQNRHLYYLQMCSRLQKHCLSESSGFHFPEYKTSTGRSLCLSLNRYCYNLEETPPPF